MGFINQFITRGAPPCMNLHGLAILTFTRGRGFELSSNMGSPFSSWLSEELPGHSLPMFYCAECGCRARRGWVVSRHSVRPFCLVVTCVSPDFFTCLIQIWLVWLNDHDDFPNVEVMGLHYHALSQSHRGRSLKLYVYPLVMSKRLLKIAQSK